MAQASIIFVDGFDEFAILMPASNDVKTVAKTLANVKHVRIGMPLYAGKVAAEFLAEHRKICSQTRLASPGKVKVGSNLQYRVNLVLDSVTVRENGKTVFMGQQSRFSTWAQASDSIRSNIDKIITFVYRGGSESGKRIVKLTSVEDTSNGTLLRGLDVVKGTAEKPAYRTYYVRNIVGNVEVLN